MQRDPDFTLDELSLMLVDGLAPSGNSQVYSAVEGGHKYASPHASIVIHENPGELSSSTVKTKYLPAQTPMPLNGIRKKYMPDWNHIDAGKIVR